MHRLLAASLLLAVLPAFAQAPPPPKLEPLPEPPPQVGLDSDPSQPGPRISPGSKIEEFTMPDGTKHITVTDPNGWTYHLVEAQPGEPAGARTVNTDTGVRAPMWSILQW